jgi:hypothetical protein
MVDLDQIERLLRSLKKKTYYSQLRKKLFYRWRKIHGKERMLPAFIIIGAQKAGTTSLFQYLKNHPSIIEPARKEIFFFDGGRAKGEDIFIEQGLDWYRLHFPRIHSSHPNRCTYEATTNYLYSRIAAPRIHQILPTVKLIAILRNPVDRAISHYQHNLRKGREQRSLAEAIRADENTLASLYYSYKSRGLYHEQLLRYKLFLDRNQLLIVESEGLSKEPASTMRHIYTFLGLDPSLAKIPTGRRHNASRQKATVEPADIDFLRNYFKPHNEKLFDLIGQRFPW